MRQEGEQEEGQTRMHKGVHCVSGLCQVQGNSMKSETLRSNFKTSQILTQNTPF